MEVILYILAAVLVAGCGIAIYERRKGRILLRHDLDQSGPQTETDRDIIRTQDMLRGHSKDVPPSA